MKLVRVKLENGVLSTVSDALARRASLEVLDPEKHPAVDKRGKAVPDEHPDPAESEDSEDDTGDKPPMGEQAGPLAFLSPPAHTNPPEGS